MISSPLRSKARQRVLAALGDLGIICPRYAPQRALVGFGYHARPRLGLYGSRILNEPFAVLLEAGAWRETRSTHKRTLQLRRIVRP